MSKLADLKLGTGAIKRFSFERPNFQGGMQVCTVAIRPLTKAQIDEARLQAQATVDLLDKNVRQNASYEELMQEARVVEMLSRALRDPDKPEEAWTNPLEIGQTFDLGTIGLLAREYEEVQAKFSPFLSDLTNEQFEAMVAAIAKEGDASPFFFCALPLQSAFITTLARELVTSRTQSLSSSSDSTTPSSDSPTSTSNETATGPALEGELASLRSDIALLMDHVASLETRLRHAEAAEHRRDIAIDPNE